MTNPVKGSHHSPIECSLIHTGFVVSSQREQYNCFQNTFWKLFSVLATHHRLLTNESQPYCLTAPQSFLVIVHCPCLFWESPAASSWPSIQSLTSFLLIFFLKKPPLSYTLHGQNIDSTAALSPLSPHACELIARLLLLRPLRSPYATSVATTHSVGIWHKDWH